MPLDRQEPIVAFSRAGPLFSTASSRTQRTENGQFSVAPGTVLGTLSLTNAPSRDKLHARTDASHRIGTDTCGLAHYHDPLLGVVWTTTALGDIAHVIQCDELSTWSDFVRDDRGWIDCHYSERSLADAIATGFTQEAV